MGGPGGLFSFSASSGGPAPVPVPGAKRPFGAVGAAAEPEYPPEVIKAIGSLTVLNAAQIRTAAAMLYDVHTMEAEQPTPIAVQAKGRWYFTSVKGNPKHKLGPPHAHLAAALMQSCFELPTLDATIKKLIFDVAQNFDSPEKLGRLLPVVRYSTTFKKQTRIQIGYSYEAQALNLPNAIRAAFEQQKADYKMGDAPRGPLERQIITALGLNAQAE